MCTVKATLNSIVLEEIEPALFTIVVLVFFNELFTCGFRRKRERLSIKRALVKSMYRNHIFKSMCGARVENLVVK